MKSLIVEPDGWPCKFSECPPGPFVFDGTPCFMSEYKTHGRSEAFNEAGEVFWGGVDTPEARDELIVQPCKFVWLEE